ncbi:hypothetical protein V6N00_12605 [Tersicoccus sp. MR15.9]|uniref:hypothetical protein n=1 Tax=Tersicoccus mangrovi TaxID=3121635 RepID=UPI002FE6B728
MTTTPVAPLTDPATLLALTDMLDEATDVAGDRLSADARARIFAAVDTGTAEHWKAARSAVVAAPMTTLWQAVVAVGCPETAVPTRAQILLGLEHAIAEAYA